MVCNDLAGLRIGLQVLLNQQLAKKLITGFRNFALHYFFVFIVAVAAIARGRSQSRLARISHRRVAGWGEGGLEKCWKGRLFMA